MAEHHSLQTEPVRPMRGGGLVKKLNRVLPLGRHYRRLFAILNGTTGLVQVPFGDWQLVMPACWPKLATSYMLDGPEIFVDFHQLLGPMLDEIPDGTIVDAGANLGLYTLLMRGRRDLPVVCYEPLPFVFQLLQANIAHNGLQHVELRNVACSDADGEIPFAVGVNGYVARDAAAVTGVTAKGDVQQQAAATIRGGGVVNVPMRTLDRDLAEVERISLLKIDCEGFEHHILLGAREIIRRHRPYIFLELHPVALEAYGRTPEAVIELLSQNYDMEFWDYAGHRFHSRLMQSLVKNRGAAGRRLSGAAEALRVCAQHPRPAQIFVAGRPR